MVKSADIFPIRMWSGLKSRSTSSGSLLRNCKVSQCLISISSSFVCLSSSYLQTYICQKPFRLGWLVVVPWTATARES